MSEVLIQHDLSTEQLLRESNIRTARQIKQECQDRGMVISPTTVSAVARLMTPIDARTQPIRFPDIITPLQYPNFDALLGKRPFIQSLRLVTQRPKPIQTQYKSVDAARFVDMVNRHYLINGSPISIVSELFPSDLPPDVRQRVIWVRDDNRPDDEVASFITRIMFLDGLGVDDIILFERSRIPKIPFVSVSVPSIRHIHMWSRA